MLSYGLSLSGSLLDRIVYMAYFLSVDIPLGGYWKWWECTELEGLVPGYQYVLLSDRLHNLARIINLNFDFILIKSKLYIRPLGSL